MQTVLFHSTIFGPIHSRRLGSSLGINLMPADGKVCSFDCLYCEAGFNAQGPGKAGLPSRTEVARLLEEKLQQMKKSGEPLDVITFSGNGEPTLHPDFAGVIDDTIRLRDRYFPTVKISVLTNSTRIGDNQVADALRRIDNNILKLDSAIDGTVQRLDRPNSPDYSVERVISELSQFKETGIIQTMILRGEHDGNTIDNTTETEISALIDAYRQIRPRSIMLYSIDRKTPAERLHKVEADELKAIADRIMAETSIPVTTA
ncbi:MAG: radical SAM protein [Muribaculaceae bacterium]|nr:radical SAM protein [Muribaculaceae bacterium]